MLAHMSARELLEWQAYLKGRGQFEALVADKVDPVIAYRMTWDPRAADREDG